MHLNINVSATFTNIDKLSTKKPDVSCLMSTYAGDDPRHLNVALKSIDTQKDVNLELVLVIDGKVSDEIKRIIDEHCLSTAFDTTIIQLKDNVGLAAALNQGLLNCRSDLIARFDSDDISEPTRLLIQVKYMREHPRTDVLGGSLTLINNDDTPIGTRIYPRHHNDIKRYFFLRNPVPHPAVIFRRDKIIQSGGYPLFRKAQDYALWGRCLVNGFHFSNLSQNLVRMRIGTGLQERRGLKYFRFEASVLVYLLHIRCITIPQFCVAYSLRFASRLLNNFIVYYSYQLNKFS